MELDIIVIIVYSSYHERFPIDKKQRKTIESILILSLNTYVQEKNQ